MATAADWMTPMPTLVRKDEPIARAAVVLSKHAFRHLPVIDGDGHLAGLLLDYSVFAKGGLVWGGKAGHELWMPFDEADAELTVEAVMQPAQGVCSEDDPLEFVLRQLAKIGQDMVVVVNENRHPVGVISEHDPMRYASEVILATRPAKLDASAPVLTTRLDEPAMKALARMVEANIRHLPVVDEQGRVEAVVSYRDLVSACGDGSQTRRVEYAIAHLGARVLPKDASTAGCARVMADHRIGCLPIVDANERPTHIITRTDVIRAAADQLEDDGLFID
ncbi:MAG: CBS domain-containing protein [Deltaproteobacteria bacterium]|nr:MAG: CBS domain-containing protein [Deltaproteobacteria bacterium]